MENFRSPYEQSYIDGGRKVEFHGDINSAGVDQMYVARSRNMGGNTTHNYGITKGRRTRSPSLFSSVKTWFDDPETRRKKRVAKYKMYSIEGKVKSSVKRGYRWIKRKCNTIVHGY